MPQPRIMVLWWGTGHVLEPHLISSVPAVSALPHLQGSVTPVPVSTTPMSYLTTSNPGKRACVSVVVEMQALVGARCWVLPFKTYS
jgi:hypothetical protein